MGVMNACITHRSNALTKTDGSAYNIQISTITPGAASQTKVNLNGRQRRCATDRQTETVSNAHMAITRIVLEDMQKLK